MKISSSLIAIAAVAVLPLTAIAGDKDKMSTPQATSAQFEKLDTNRDGRISQSEASSDAKIVFSSADKNGDGYLDSNEYAHRSRSNEAMPNSDSATDSTVPRTDATASDSESTTPRE
jgi:Ca2+-binding EF-hand superfamily protein